MTSSIPESFSFPVSDSESLMIDADEFVDVTLTVEGLRTWPLPLDIWV